MKSIEEQRIEVCNELVKIADEIKLSAEGMKKFAFYGLTDEKVKEYYSTLKLETNPEKRWIEISVCTENKNKFSEVFNKDNFLKSEAGVVLIHMIKKWDKALAENDNKNVITCIFYWRAVRDTLQYFMNEKYYFYRNESRCGIMDDNGNWLFQIR